MDNLGPYSAGGTAKTHFPHVNAEDQSAQTIDITKNCDLGGPFEGTSGGCPDSFGEAAPSKFGAY